MDHFQVNRPALSGAITGAVIWVAAGTLLSGFAYRSATAQVDSAAVPEKSVIEKMAGQRGTSVVSSEEMGRIESSDAQATITAVIVDNPHYQPSRARGVRVNLKNQTSSDYFFVEENALVNLKHELDGMDCSAARMRNESGAPYRMHGIARCRPSQSVPQAYCPGYYIAPDSEGFALATFSGGNFKFPSTRPASFADAIGRAMIEFGLDNEIPAAKMIELPADDLAQIVASAIRHFPELASSPGVKAAGYDSPENNNSATVIFWPYERAGDMAYSRLVECDAIGTAGEGWICDRGRPRAYLTIPGQEFEVVITDELDRELAIALVEFAKRKLQDEPSYANMDDWKFTLIRVPDQALEAFLVTGSDVEVGSFAFEIKHAPEDNEERFELIRVSRSSRDGCGTTS